MSLTIENTALALEWLAVGAIIGGAFIFIHWPGVI